jgi:hypothetical protein
MLLLIKTLPVDGNWQASSGILEACPERDVRISFINFGSYLKERKGIC